MSDTRGFSIDTDKGRLAGDFLLANIRTQLHPGDAIRKAVEEVSTFDEVKNLIVSAIIHPNPRQVDDYGLLVRHGINHANYHLEAGEYHAKVEGEGNGSFEALVYGELLGEEVSAEAMAEQISNLAALLNDNVRIITLEKKPGDKKGLFYILPFSIYKDTFITRTFNDGVTFKDIVDSESPESIFRLAADLAKIRVTRGNEYDKYETVLEHAFCELMMLYLVPVILSSKKQEVREILDKNCDIDGLALFNSILAFQEEIATDAQSGNLDRILPVLYMIRMRQIYGINGILRDVISRTEGKPLHASIVGTLSKKASNAKSGQRQRIEKLLELQEQSDFGIEYGFMLGHEDTQIIEDDLALLGAEAKALFDNLPTETRTLLQKKGIIIKNLPNISLCAKEFNINEVTFSVTSDKVIAKFSNEDGITYKLNISEQLQVNDHALFILQSFLRMVLSEYDSKQKVLRTSNLVDPNESQMEPASLDVVDDITAEVTPTPRLWTLLQSGKAILTGVITAGDFPHVYVADVGIYERQKNKFEFRLLRAIYPIPQISAPELQMAEGSTNVVQLGDSAAAIQAKIESRTKKRKNLKVQDKPERIKSLEDLERALKERGEL